MAAGALVVAIGCFLPWWSVGGTVTEQHTGNAFDSVLGMVVFAIALAVVAVMVLPYATASRYSPFDRRAVYVLLFLFGLGAFVARLLQINSPDFGGLGLPDVTPGAWITGAGFAVLLLGLIDLFGEAPRDDF